MDAGVVSKVRGDQQVAPIGFGKRDRLGKLVQSPLAELQDREAKPLELDIVELIEEGQIVSALLGQGFADDVPLAWWKQQPDPTLRLGAKAGRGQGAIPLDCVCTIGMTGRADARSP